MANVFNGERWVIDTPSANMVFSQHAFIKSVRWVAAGCTKGVSTVEIEDAAGVTRWRSIADDTVCDHAQGIENWWYGGFKVPTLDQGIVIVDMK